MVTAETKSRATPQTRPVGPCPLCGTDRSTLIRRLRDRLHGTPGEFQYRRCGACRTVFQDPRVIPEDLALCYPSDYYTHSPAPPREADSNPIDNHARPAKGFRGSLRRAVVAAVRGEPGGGVVSALGWLLARSSAVRRRAFFGHVEDVLLPRRPGTLRALDIGCGSGLLMTALRRVGYEVEGVEWDQDAAGAARRTSGANVRVGDFQKADLPLASFDLVTLSHVFEHLDDPVGALRRVRELLTPTGRAVLWYPNPDALGRYVYGDCWFPWEAPRHLVLPPPNALAKAARGVGLVPLQVTTTARHASSFCAYSASYRAGQPIGDLWPPRAMPGTRMLGVLERLLVGIGVSAGEEAVVVLRRSDGHP